MATNPNMDTERKYWIITDDDPPIGAAEQTASTYYILAQNSDQEIPEELQNLIQSIDPVENSESPNPQPEPEDLLKLMNKGGYEIPAGLPLFIPNIPPRILNGATYQDVVPGESTVELIIILESAQGYQHNATVTFLPYTFNLVRVAGQLPSGTPYILSAPEPLSEADNKKLGQLRQQRDKQEENNNRPESTDGSSDD